jgi:hypothetical protein
MAVSTALKALDKATPSVKLDHIPHLPSLDKSPANHLVGLLRGSDKDRKRRKPLPRVVDPSRPGHPTDREAWLEVTILVDKRP